MFAPDLQNRSINSRLAVQRQQFWTYFGRLAAAIAALADWRPPLLRLEMHHPPYSEVDGPEGSWLLTLYFFSVAIVSSGVRQRSAEAGITI